MKLAKLDLLAYGPFSGVTLDLGAPGLHVIIGRNEAGKSTTLRAITGLLYGIDARTPDAHVFKTTDLRIGGVLESSGGQSLRVVRRKGNANTLLDERQQVLDESVLKRLLGGVSRETFQFAFGLDHDTLEAGAKALLEGRGDLGESLFDASVGGGGEVQRLVAELSAEADAIYKPRASSLPLNDALKAFAEAQKVVREKQSLPEAFLEQERGLEVVVAERAALLVTKKEVETKKTRLTRARSRVPLERRRGRALERRAELGAICQQVARVEALQARFGVYERLLEQRRELSGEAERLADRIVDTARRAGVDPKAAADELRFEARKEARIQALLRDRAALTKQLDAATVEIVRLERERERISASSKGKAEPGDRTHAELALSVALERARPFGAALARLTTERARLERRTKDLEAIVAALTPRVFEDTLDAFVALRLPAIETLERLEKRDSEIERALVRLEERRADLDREAASIERQTASRKGEFSPPDAEALEQARKARDVAWRRLRTAEDTERRSLESDVERLLHEADVVADRMIREADRVTDLARLRAEAETNARQLDKVAEERRRVLGERVDLEKELAVLLAEAGLKPLGLSETRRFLEAHKQVGEMFRALREARAELLEDEQRTSAAQLELATALANARDDAAPRTDETVGLTDLITRAAAHLTTMETSRREAKDAERLLVEMQTKLDERAAARAQSEGALAESIAKLAELLGPLGIAADAMADEVTSALETLRELFTVIDKRTETEGRRRLVESDIGDFERELASAIAELAPDLGVVSLRDSAPVLFARAADAKANERDLATVLERLEGEGELVLDEDERLLVADDEAAERAERELAEQLEAVDRDIGSLAERIGSYRAGLDVMRAESHAADAAAQAQHHLSRIRENVERWSRAKLASVILSREIERYREENQAPLLASSSALFARLTLGAFSGIKAGFDDKDRPCLRCVRATGGEVDVTGLSEGTRDQLYLSLRLASLLRRAEVAEPMPLVLDDVLIQFDDQRSAAALSVLAEVSRRMQVLFFTHHARLVDLARAAIPEGELVIHELSNARGPTEAATASV